MSAKSILTDSQWEYFFDIKVFLTTFEHYLTKVSQIVVEEELKANERFQLKWAEVVQDHPNPLNAQLEEADYQEYWALSGLSDLYFESAFTSFYSFLESRLQQLCSRVEKKKKIKLNDISHKGLRKYRLYLNKVCDVDFSEIDHQWDSLLKYAAFRNHLVHSQGVRTLNQRDDQQLLNFLRKLDGMHLFKSDSETEEWNFHIGSRTVIEEMVNLSKPIFDFLYLKLML